MRTWMKALSLAFSLLMLLALAACGGKTETPAVQDTNEQPENTLDEHELPLMPADDGPAAPEDTRLDYGWVKFEMPEGYVDAKESDSYLTIESSENSKHVMKVFRKYSGSSTAAEMAEERANSADRYTLGEPVTLNGREWYVVNFEFNGNPSVIVYSEAYENYCVYVTVYEMTLDDPDVLTLLNSVELVPEE